MTDHWVITLMGDEQPHLVAALADIISEYQGSWLDSHISELGGKFAGIISLVVPKTESAGLQEALEALADGRDLSMHIGVEGKGLEQVELCSEIRITANDRPGIVQAITDVLSEHRANALELITRCESAPWGGEPLFSAFLQIECDADTLEQIKLQLEAMGDDFIVDIEPPAEAENTVH